MRRPGRLLAVALAAALAGCASLPKVFGDADPLSADEHARLGAAYEAQGALPDAETQYLRALALDKRHEGAWMALGRRAFENGDYAKARRCYARVLRLSRTPAAASNNLAMVYVAQNRRLDEAEALAKTALELDESLRPYVLDTLAQIERRRRR